MPLRVPLDERRHMEPDCREQDYSSFPRRWQIWSGRPRATTEEEADPFQSAEDIREALSLTVSSETVRRRLSELGLQSFVAAQKPCLSDSQLQERLMFATAMKDWTTEEWGDVIFSDESTFSTRWDQRKRSVLSSGRCSVSVWGAISKDGLGPLVRLEGPFTASRYCDVITRHLVPYALDGPFSDGCYFFQHDRSPIHKARIVQSLLEKHAVCQLEWPPCGADLNPIENVWGMLKKRLSTRANRGRTADTLWQAIAQEWESLRGRPEITEYLYESMPTRINKQNLGAGDQIPAATVT
ncbi:hypothetical protein HPB52_011596 [Rhipicephalus sanguineus]|uniref:Tc1-like transposase DDE domain-containing protein n=1 Tax=Rhipicephalus sanguineus TaxID=34632 RepID=A0A9D4T9M2_RHISA|nr:hypothetical protein HPB52_011596 [Rhipicephalus sanguineus]